MGIKENLAKYPAVIISIGAILVVVAAVVAFRVFTTADAAGHLDNTYFSDNDGSDFFAGQSTQIEDLQRRTKPAYLATVYSCDGNRGHPFVAYLTRQPPDLLDAIDRAIANEKQVRGKYPFNDNHVVDATDSTAAARKAAEAGREVKRPGAANHWVRQSSPEGQDIMNNVKCPDGRGTPQVILP